MTAEQYGQQGVLLRAKARAEESPSVRTELENLARCYLLLARRSERRRTLQAPLHNSCSV